MFKQSINLTYLTYLNNFDLIYKFNYVNYFMLPIINKLTLNIYLKGILNSKFFILYLKNYFLLFLYCFNILNVNLKFTKFRKKKTKILKVKLFLNYTFFKKKLLKIIYDFFFLFKKFLRPFFFSKSKTVFSLNSGKSLFFFSNLIVFIPSLMLLDYKEHRIFPFFKSSKIFFCLFIKINTTNEFFNFFNSFKTFNKNYLKNFLLFWSLL